MDAKLERLETAEDTGSARNGQAEEASTQEEQIAGWTINESTNPLDDSTTVTASLNATEGVASSGLNPSPFKLVVRCQSGQIEAFICWHEYLGDDSDDLSEWKRVTYRFPPADAETRRWSISTDGNATFVPVPSLFLESLAGGERLVAQTIPYDQSPAMAIFDLNGAAAVVARVEQARRQHKEEEEAKRQRKEAQQKREREDAERQHKEAQRKRLEEEAQRQHEEEQRQRREAEEEAQRQHEEARRKREREDAERQHKEAQRKRLEEEAQRQHEEEQRQRREAEEEAQRQHKEAQRKREREDAERQHKEAQRKRLEEEAQRQHEEEQRQRRETEEEAQRQHKEAQRKREREDAERQHKEAQRKRLEEEAQRQHEEEQRQRRETEEEAQRQHEEAQKQHREAEEKARRQRNEARRKREHEEEVQRQHKEDERKRKIQHLAVDQETAAYRLCLPGVAEALVQAGAHLAYRKYESEERVYHPDYVRSVSVESLILLKPSSIGLAILNVFSGDPKDVIVALGNYCAGFWTNDKPGQIEVAVKTNAANIDSSLWRLGDAQIEVRHATSVVLWNAPVLVSAMTHPHTMPEQALLALLKPSLY